MAGHLITLKQGLLLLAEKPVISEHFFNGSAGHRWKFYRKKWVQKRNRNIWKMLLTVCKRIKVRVYHVLYADLQNLLELKRKH